MIFRLLNWSYFLGLNRLFVLWFENVNDRIGYTECFLPTSETKDCNVIIDGQNVFDLSVKNNLRTYNSIQEFVTSQGDDYTNVCLLDHS